MSVSKAIIIGSLVIAASVFFMRVPIYSLHHVATNEYIRFNETTGNASVCFIKKIEQETMPDLAASREEGMKPSADAMLAELDAMTKAEREKQVADAMLAEYEALAAPAPAPTVTPQPTPKVQPKAPSQIPQEHVWVCDSLKSI
ncbi:MAG: hypothetical protein E6Q51_02765 [Methylophilus methylotrophus]|uniref:Uncharacterized protein n=1 Tax=Methylophilus methylotrophus TaxID=17 RepID=A0A5C7WLZ6_METME|nr:MAG: hypothetical protein E6Q51_02765 [Methylophilus methylotrophus]